MDTLQASYKKLLKANKRAAKIRQHLRFMIEQIDEYLTHTGL